MFLPARIWNGSVAPPLISSARAILGTVGDRLCSSSSTTTGLLSPLFKQVQERPPIQSSVFASGLCEFERNRNNNLSIGYRNYQRHPLILQRHRLNPVFTQVSSNFHSLSSFSQAGNKPQDPVSFKRCMSSKSEKDYDGSKKSEKEKRSDKHINNVKDVSKRGNENSPSEPIVVTVKDGLSSKESASNFLAQLSDHQKELIYHTLNIEILRDKYKGKHGSSRKESYYFLSKFGRLTTMTKMDPPEIMSEATPNMLEVQLDEKPQPVPGSAIWAVVLKNGLPFVGFGFLDNIIMILAGDYIDLTIGAALGISTMAAAALGNTISDVAGIASAWYVEAMATRIGIKDPDLTPSQMQSSAVRWACNLGRALGVTLGCLLGMFPLLFFPSAEEKELLKAKLSEEGEGVKKV